MTDNTQAHMQLAGATPSAGVLLHSMHATSALVLITSEHRQKEGLGRGSEGHHGQKQAVTQGLS